jgi:hypothetical protein
MVPINERDKELDRIAEFGIDRDGHKLEQLNKRITITVQMYSTADREEWAFWVRELLLTCTEISREESRDKKTKKMRVYQIVYSVRGTEEHIASLENRHNRFLAGDESCLYPRIVSLTYGEISVPRGVVQGFQGIGGLPTHRDNVRYLSPAPSPGRKPPVKKSCIVKVSGGFRPNILDETTQEVIAQKQACLPQNHVSPPNPHNPGMDSEDTGYLAMVKREQEKLNNWELG